MSDDVKPVIKQEMLDDEPQSGSPALLSNVLQLVKQELGTLKTEGDCSIPKLLISEPSGVSKFEIIPMSTNQFAENVQQETPQLPEVTNSVETHGLITENSCLNDDPSFVCEICQSTFKSKRGLAIHRSCVHKKPHNPRERKKCSICGKLYLEAYLKIHSKRVHSSQVGRHVCSFDGCGRRFVRICELKRHMRLVHPNKGEHVCSVKGCGRRFARICELNCHMKRKHGPSKACHICGSVVKFLKVHIRYVHFKQKQFECDICGKKFKRRYQLVNHRRRHSGIKSFPCSLCKYSAYEENELTLHEARIHGTGKRAAKNKLKCETCGKVFFSKSQLRNHNNSVHSGKRPFSCSYCDYKYSHKSRLAIHEAKCHSDEDKRNGHDNIPDKQAFGTHKGGQFSCYKCLKPFDNEMDKDLHMISKVCWTEKQFPCTICDKKYASKYSLNSHIKRSHSTNQS